MVIVKSEFGILRFLLCLKRRTAPIRFAIWMSIPDSDEKEDEERQVQRLEPGFSPVMCQNRIQAAELKPSPPEFRQHFLTYLPKCAEDDARKETKADQAKVEV
jgi:hypothetical protein